MITFCFLVLDFIGVLALALLLFTRNLQNTIKFKNVLSPRTFPRPLEHCCRKENWYLSGIPKSVELIHDIQNRNFLVSYVDGGIVKLGGTLHSTAKVSVRLNGVGALFCFADAQSLQNSNPQILEIKTHLLEDDHELGSEAIQVVDWFLAELLLCIVDEIDNSDIKFNYFGAYPVFLRPCDVLPDLLQRKSQFRSCRGVSLFAKAVQKDLCQQ